MSFIENNTQYSSVNSYKSSAYSSKNTNLSYSYGSPKTKLVDNLTVAMSSPYTEQNTSYISSKNIFNESQLSQKFKSSEINDVSAISCSCSSDLMSVNDLVKNCVSLAKNQAGCRSIQRLIESDSRIIREGLLDNVNL